MIDFVLTKKIIFYYSPELIEEYKNSIIRDFGESIQDAGKKADLFGLIFELVYPPIKVFACEDKDDNKVLEVALEANTDFVILSDKHLLKMKECKGIKILTASQVIEFFTL
ncbi:MAG: putative toxin-antitoxin system toxin component, PIN family [Candidatus Iainarchaeum sp.]